MITTMEQLQAYLAEMTKLAESAAPFGVAANVESICARIWKQLTPHALAFWTIPGVLDHLSACLTPPDELEDEDNTDDE